MTVGLDQLSSEVFGRICENLTDIGDVFNLQLTNRRIYAQVERTFWGRPRRLRLTDSSNSFLFLDSGRLCVLPPTRTALDVVTRRARNLTEFDLASECARDESHLMDVIRVLKQNVSKITCLHLSYINASSMYGEHNGDGATRLRDARKPATRAFPSLRGHKKICDLIALHSPHLQLLHIRMNNAGLVSIGRSRTGEELHVEFNCPCDGVVRQLLCPVFEGFSADCRRLPRVFRLGINVADVESSQLVFDYCTQRGVPKGARLEEIHCRIQNADFAALFNIEEMGPALRKSLEKIVWHIEQPPTSSLNGVRSTVCEVQLKAKPLAHDRDAAEEAEAGDEVRDLRPLLRPFAGSRPRHVRQQRLLRRLQCAS